MSQKPSNEVIQPESGVLPVPRRSPWRRILLGVVILVCGIAIGAGGATIVSHKITRRHILQAVHRSSRTPDLMAKRIESELHLSPVQAKQVREIVVQRMAAVREIMDENRPRVEEQFNLMKEEVAQVLDKDQAREWRHRFERLRRPPRPSRGRHRSGDSERGKGARDESSRPQPEGRGEGRAHERRQSPRDP